MYFQSTTRRGRRSHMKKYRRTQFITRISQIYIGLHLVQPKYVSHKKNFKNLTLKHFQCLVSIFRMHNETVNIWTHLLGFLIFSILLPYDLLISLPEIGSGYSFYLTHAAFASTVGLFFFLSAAYHIFRYC